MHAIKVQILVKHAIPFLIIIWFCIGCNSKDTMVENPVISENLEISKQPYYHKHPYKGPVHSVKFINNPEKNTDGLFGKYKRKNSYMDDINMPLEYERYHINFYAEFDTLGNRIAMAMFTNTKVKSHKDSINNFTRERIHQVANSKNLDLVRPVTKLYYYDYKQLDALKEKYGEGQKHYPAYWTLFSFGAPTYKSVSCIYDRPPVYDGVDTALTYTYTVPRTGEQKVGNYYGASSIYKFEYLSDKNPYSERLVKTNGKFPFLGWGDTLFKPSLVSLDSYSSGLERYGGRYTYPFYRSKDKQVEINTQSFTEYKYNHLGLLIQKNYIGHINRSSTYTNAWIDHRFANDMGLLDTDYTVSKNDPDTVVEYFEYDDQYRLTDQYMMAKHNYRDYKRFYYSGTKSIPDSIYANFTRLSNSNTPGDLTGWPFIARLDDEGKVIEIDHLLGRVVTDSLGYSTFKKENIESRRIYKYLNYDKYGNWTKVDKYVWNNTNEIYNRLQMTKERQDFWSEIRFVGSQERIFEYYK